MIRLLLIRLLESYFRHRWLYLVPLTLMIGLGVVAALLPSEYRTVGVVYVQQETYLSSLISVRPGDAIYQTPAGFAANQINELLQTDSFVRAMISKTDLESEMSEGPTAVRETIKEVRESTFARAVGTNHVEVNVYHESARTSFQLAGAALDSFIQWQINADLNESLAAEQFLNELVNTYRAEVEASRAALDTYLLEHPEPPRSTRPLVEELEIDRLRSDVAFAESRFANALDKEENARLATAQTEQDVRQRFLLIDAPAVPLQPERGLRDAALRLAIFGTVGGILTIGMITAGALVDNSIRFPIDVNELLDARVLTVLPETESPSSSAEGVSSSKESTEQPSKSNALSTPGEPAAAD